MQNMVGLEPVMPLDGGLKNAIFFFACLSYILIGQVCAKGIAIKAFEFWNGFDNIE